MDDLVKRLAELGKFVEAVADLSDGDVLTINEAHGRVIALTEDLAARDKAHECDAQIAADLIAGEQAKRYEVEAERDKLIAALVEIHDKAMDVTRKYHAVAGNRGPRMAYASALHEIATFAQATQETSNATQGEKQNG